MRQGDVVDLGQHAGLVEEVTLRYVRLRDYDGNVHFVPNGTIASVINMGRGHSQAVVDIGVGYGVDIDQAMAVMHEVAAALRASPAFAGVSVPNWPPALVVWAQAAINSGVTLNLG